jgi:antitoxin StbD
MEIVLANTSVSISELKRSPTAVIEQAGGAAVAVLNHNRPAAYLVPAAAYEAMLERLDELDLVEIAKARMHEPSILVNPDDL